jgi:hypothetical protein
MILISFGSNLGGMIAVVGVGIENSKVRRRDGEIKILCGRGLHSLTPAYMPHI